MDSSKKEVKFHLCCGPSPLDGWVNVDMFDFGQEVVFDLTKEWDFAASGSVDRIFCKDGLEHLPSVEHFFRESARILRPGGVLEIWVAHFKNPSAYRVTHHHWFSWSYFDIYPEPHDDVKDLRILTNTIYIGRKSSALWRPIHWLANLNPKWWERLFYVSNIEATFQKQFPAELGRGGDCD